MDKKSKAGYLAVFWRIPHTGDFIGAIDVRNGPTVDVYGDYLQVDADHFELWEAEYKDKWSGVEYDFYPRGRVMFNTVLHKYVVVGSDAIVNDANVRENIKRFYGLPETTIFRWDEHYG